MNESIEKLKNNRSFQGVWIPKEIWFDERLDAIEKCLLAEIIYLDNDFHCTASNGYFANFLGCSESKVSKSIAKLLDMRYISTVSFDGRIRVLKSNVHYTIVE